MVYIVDPTLKSSSRHEEMSPKESNTILRKIGLGIIIAFILFLSFIFISSYTDVSPTYDIDIDSRIKDIEPEEKYFPSIPTTVGN